MTTREKMIKWRNKNRITLRFLSDRSGVSETLLSMVEAGEVTHPKIVKKIQKVYRLNDLEAEELMPKIHRPHDPEYEPDKYKHPADMFNEKLLPKKELIETYICEKQDVAVRQHQKRGVY